MSSFGRIFLALKAVYKRPRYIALNLAFIAVYYYLFRYLVLLQNRGLFLVLGVPLYLIYAVVITSSILMTVAIYTVFARRSPYNVYGGVLGSASAVVAGIVSGCGCTAPLVLGGFTLVVGVSEATYLNNFLSDNTFAILLFFLFLNLLMFVYYLYHMPDSCIYGTSAKRRAGRNAKNARR